MLSVACRIVNVILRSYSDDLFNKTCVLEVHMFTEQKFYYT